MADLVNTPELLDEFEAEMAEETGFDSVVEGMQEQVALTNEEDLEGFANCFADWDLRPGDVPKK